MKRCVSMLVLAFLTIFVSTAWSAAAPGTLAWHGTLGGTGFTWSSPIAVNGMVYVQDQDSGGITCLDAYTGALKWFKTAADSGTVSSPVYRKGWIILFGSKVYKVNAKTGSADEIFTPGEGEYIASKAPAVSDSTVFFSTDAGLYAVDLDSFAQKWKRPGSSGNVVIDGNVVYFMSDKVYALNPANGSEYWSIPSPNSEDPEGFNMGAVSGNSLVVFSELDLWGDGTTKLWAYTLNPDPTQPPAERWHASMGNKWADDAPPVIDGDRVFANTRAGILTAFDLDGDGTPLWSQPVRTVDNATALPIAVGGKVYTQEEVGEGGSLQVVCRDGGTGAVVWQTSEEGMGISWAQPALYLDKVILAVDHQGGVYAFEAGTPGGSWYMMQQNPALTGSDTGWVPEPLLDGGFYVIPKKTSGGAVIYLE